MKAKNIVRLKFYSMLTRETKLRLLVTLLTELLIETDWIDIRLRHGEFDLESSGNMFFDKKLL